MNAPSRPPLDQSGIAALAAELVRIPSFPGTPRQEEAVAAALAAALAAHGLRAELVEVEPGRPNLLCTLAAAAPGPRLLLCGHTDTVPANAGEPGSALAGQLRDGRLHGRGAVDMKGALAAMVACLAELAAAGGPAAGAVTLAAVVDEEMAGAGVEHLIDAGVAADGAIVGEPTGNRPCVGHKGLEWLEVTLVGRAAHGGRPQAGINAIVAAARLVEQIERRLLPRLARRTHPLLGPPTLNLGRIRGGDQPSTVAAGCTLALDRRLVPGESYASAVAELEELVAAVAATMPGLTATVGRFPGGAGGRERRAFVTAEDDPLVGAVTSACREVQGRAPALDVFPAWTDGGLLASEAGIPTVILGPGELALAHSPRESVPVAELAEAARLYAAAARAFCRPRPGGAG